MNYFLLPNIWYVVVKTIMCGNVSLVSTFELRSQISYKRKNNILLSSAKEKYLSH